MKIHGWMAALALLLAGCEDTTPLGGSGVAEGDLLAVAGFQRLQLRAAGDPDSLLWETGLGQAANGLLAVEDQLFVLNSVSHQLQVVERSGDSLRAAAAFDVGLLEGGNPYELAWHDGRILLSELLADQVSVWDPASGARLGAFPTAQAPEGLLVDGDRLFVVGSGFDFTTLAFGRGWLVEHDAADGAKRDSLELGINPQFLAKDPLGRLHVTCTGDYAGQPGQIWIVATDPLRVLQVVDCPQGYPGRLVLASWGKAYVAAGGWLSAGAEAGLVLEYDWAAPDTPSVLAVGRGAIDVALDEERGGVWALCMDEPCLQWIDRESGPGRRVDLPEPGQRLLFWPRAEP